MKKTLILASASPRRREILALAGYDFKVLPSNAEEKSGGLSASGLVVANALAKARDIFAQNVDSVVLGADTVVALGDEILGKPKNENEAKAMLGRLSGSRHSVLTGFAVISEKGELSGYCETEVKFRRLSQEEIDAYVATGEPLDKAGSYGIQEKGCLLAESVSGDFFNIIGLPVAKIYPLLAENGVLPEWFIRN
ncbi:MAG: septum formation protein Maf [Clostridia bacterium]|nr:septum formation protein Maf [Clostridia bacterium]